MTPACFQLLDLHPDPIGTTQPCCCHHYGVHTASYHKDAITKSPQSKGTSSLTLRKGNSGHNPKCLWGRHTSAALAQGCCESVVRHVHISVSGAGPTLAAAAAQVHQGEGQLPLHHTS